MSLKFLVFIVINFVKTFFGHNKFIVTTVTNVTPVAPVSTVTNVTTVTTDTTDTTVTTVNTVSTVTTIVVKYHILLLYYSKGNLFTKSHDQQTDRPTDN